MRMMKIRKHLRLAFCSLEEAAIEPLVEALGRVCEKHDYAKIAKV